ncbi:protein of unknown function [Cupriavidus taiwanensis]|nr:protein of unknown function [Cupriavidus taiwanensis]
MRGTGSGHSRSCHKSGKSFC